MFIFIWAWCYTLFCNKKSKLQDKIKKEIPLQLVTEEEEKEDEKEKNNISEKN